jgi:dTDP-4-amino-4,6-dideoxygalactose transaminase
VYNGTGRTFGDEEIEAVTRVLRSGRLNSTVGTETSRLEQEFAAYYGVPSAVASSSGTAAIHLAVAAVNPEPGDEIITTGLSDAGTVLPILAQNAVPVFADVDGLGNLDPSSVRRLITARTKAIIAVHLFGIPAPVAELRAIADEHGISLIEDCAQAYLTRCAPDGSLAGTVGHIGCFSLQQSKHISSGDGGLTITSDPALARRSKLFSDKAWPRDTDERTHLFFGLNYRMTELQAAVARVQLGRLAEVVRSRRETAAWLTTVVDELPGLAAAPESGTTYWQFPLYVDRDVAGGNGHQYAKALAEYGIPANGGYIRLPLYLTPMLAEARTYGTSGYPLKGASQEFAPGLCPRTEDLILDGGLLVIDWNEHYGADDVDAIGTALRAVHSTIARSQ